MRTLILVIALLVSTLWSSSAQARHVHFAGPHPIAAKYGGGYCYIEEPHLHIYPPDHAALYQQVGDDYVFSGDPTPFGYDGEKHPYYGHHPLTTVNGQEIICYIDGPHFHPQAPPSGDGYKMKNGVAFYVGPFSPAYATLNPRRAKAINAEYRPYQQFRPTVEVQPPPEWHGEVYVNGPSVNVAAPGVVVNAPGPPGVVVNAPGPPGVVVNAPGPPGIVVNAAVGAPGFVERRHEHDEHWEHSKHEHDEHWEHHDNGKHKGWFK